MPYIIDGHNLIPKIPGLNLGDIDVEINLIKKLGDFCRQRGRTVEVFFDNAPAGRGGTQKHGRVTARYVRRGSSADAAIRTRLGKAGRSARNMIVVTSDREVAAASREAGASVISSQDFVGKHLLGKPELGDEMEKDADLSLDPDAVDEWLELFEGGNGEP